MRKVILLASALSLMPLSAGAEELPGALVPASLTAQAAETQPSLSRVMVAAADVDAAATEGTREREKKERPSCSMGEFFDIHFGGYRWLWWAGATAALVAIHAL